MRKVLITFGSEGYEVSKERLRASASGYFDEVILYGENDVDGIFYSANYAIFQQPRGWGYWLWKPYFILKTLEALDDNDVCFYVDATVVFLSSPAILIELCIVDNGTLLFDNAHFLNYAWTKADCFNLMGLNTRKYVYGRQADAAIQVYKKTPQNITFLRELVSYCTNPHILTDAPNITGENHPAFRQHRWDQSVLSLLAIKHDIPLARSPRRDGNNYGNNGSERIIQIKRDVQKKYDDQRVTKQ